MIYIIERNLNLTDHRKLRLNKYVLTPEMVCTTILGNTCGFPNARSYYLCRSKQFTCNKIQNYNFKELTF